MRKIFIILLLAFVFSTQTNAQNLKFGHINTTDLISVMPQRDSMELQLKAFQKDYLEIYEGMRGEYNKKLEEFSANQEKWTPVVKENKQTELLELQNRIGTFEQSYQQKLAQEQDRLFAPIREKVKNAIDKVAKTGGFIYIFDLAGGNPVYISETQSTDILPLVKKELGIK